MCLSFFAFQQDFITQQKKCLRVKKAIEDKEAFITKKLDNKQLSKNALNVLVLIFKSEKILELYVKSKTNTTYELLESYNICAVSGELGPKRKQGDYQTPEGFYYVSHFNPNSSYYLSLGINYPNGSDKKKSTATDLGGDIYIHGECVTIGCVPMTNEKMKEIYLYAIYAKNSGQQKIPVYIFPFKMTDKNMTAAKASYKNNTQLIEFWKNIKQGFDAFEKEHKELKLSIDKTGNYLF